MAKTPRTPRKPAVPKANPVTAGLAQVLGATYALAIRTHIAHWNVEGPEFASLHELFGEQYRALLAAADDIAERIRALDAYAPGTPEALLASAAPAPAPRTARDMIEALHAAHKAASALCLKVAEIADDAEDSATEDMLVAFATAHDKTAWMLRSLLR